MNSQPKVLLDDGSPCVAGNLILYPLPGGRCWAAVVIGVSPDELLPLLVAPASSGYPIEIRMSARGAFSAQAAFEHMQRCGTIR